MLNNEKGILGIVIAILVVVVIILVGGGLYLKSREQLHSVMPTNNLAPLVSQDQSQQPNYEAIMRSLGCNSQSSCMQICQQPENASKCQSVFQQFGGSNGNINPNTETDFAIAGNNGNTTTASLPSCPSSNGLFDHLPTDSNAYTSVEPLGHMNGQHVLPDQADHVYINLVKDSSGKFFQLTNVYAPGNITLIQVAKKSDYIGNSNVIDYLLEFSPCKSVIFTYDHIQNLNSKIISALAGQTPICQKGGVHTDCTYQDLSIKLSSGEKIGTAGGPTTFTDAFDFGAADVRTKPLAFIDTSPTYETGVTASSYLHAVCPLDYFKDSLKSALYSKLTIKNVGANGIPQCGTTMQDKAGTLQGNWYHQGSSQNYQGLNIQGSLAFAHSNLDPTVGVLSSGSDLLPSTDLGAQILFTPTNSGYINREPSQIIPDGHVYCFDGPIAQGGTGEEGHVDLQLIDTSTLKIAYGSGACLTTPTLTNPLTYSR